MPAKEKQEKGLMMMMGFWRQCGALRVEELGSEDFLEGWGTERVFLLADIASCIASSTYPLSANRPGFSASGSLGEGREILQRLPQQLPGISWQSDQSLLSHSSSLSSFSITPPSFLLPSAPI